MGRSFTFSTCVLNQQIGRVMGKKGKKRGSKANNAKAHPNTKTQGKKMGGIISLTEGAAVKCKGGLPLVDALPVSLLEGVGSVPVL